MARPGGAPENLRPPWPKGTSGNPSGRPKRTPFAELLRKAVDETCVAGRTMPNGKTFLEMLVSKYLDLAFAATTPPAVQRQALDDLISRIEGKVADELGTTADNPVASAIREYLAHANPNNGRAKGPKAGKGRGRDAGGVAGD